MQNDIHRQRYIIGFLLLASFGTQVCRCQTMEDTQNIITSVMTDYNMVIRPSANQSQAVNVNITFQLVALREYVEIIEKLSTVGVLIIEWVDPRIRWDPTLHNGIEFVHILMDYVWKPNLILANAKDSMKAVGHGHDWMTVRYHYSGYATWHPGDIFDSSCSADVTYYPFDIQKCHLDFIPWGYLPHEVSVYSTEDAVGYWLFEENGEWVLKSATSDSFDFEETFSIYRIAIEIERRPTFFLINIVLPIMFMGFLNALVFALPAASGEKMSYAITVLLAIAVFLTIVEDNLPKTSRPMSAISYFLLIFLIISAFICIGTIVSINVYHRSPETSVPKYIAWLTRKIICKPAPKVTKIEDISRTLELSDVNISQKENELAQTWADKVITADEGDATPDPVTWKDVSLALDRVFGIVALLCLVGTSVGFIVLAATRHVSLKNNIEKRLQ